ncbi:hypothetical protein EC957_008799 [Mortierella hygrophila]|uniref:Uncharacterized protein n=1 Tax=Mortierella hygrophila TaxID=979708 RepID=A0A9P6EXH0_9FUNG|nr:hypothetical protein EC957_008799 [Mortierella hygrophila]
MDENTVVKRRCLDEGVIISSRPHPYHKWTKRGVGRYNADDTDTDNDSTDVDSDSEGYESDASSNSCESGTGKRAREGERDDDEDADDEHSASPTTLVLADFDASDLKTPVYSTAQTSGIAIRILNDVTLGGGSLSSPASLVCSIDLEPPRMLSKYKGYKKGLYHISEMATFEEDLEYVKHKNHLTSSWLRAACETDPEDEDINSGPAFAATRAVAYPESESEDEHIAGNRGDLASKVSVAAIAAAKYYKQRQDYGNGNTTPKTFCAGRVPDQELSADNDDLEHYNNNNNNNNNRYGDSLCATMTAETEDFTATAVRKLFAATTQETTKTSKISTTADSANGLYHSYEDEAGDHEDGYANHRNDDKDSFERYDEAADGATASELHYEDEYEYFDCKDDKDFDSTNTSSADVTWAASPGTASPRMAVKILV